MISVIIPIYNVENYLAQCIESVLNQTYSDIEIILVNDGSTDRCGQICDEYGKKDQRVKVIHKKNGGLSDARNVGLYNALGEYVCFIDSDDYIDKHMIEIMSSYVKCADIIICGKEDIYDDKKINQINYKSKEIVKMDGREAFRHFLLEDIEGFVVSWNKLYKRTLFTNNMIEFPVGKIHEDCFTTYKLLIKSKNIIYINLPLYKYRHREGSIMANRDIEKDMVILDAYEEIICLVKRQYKDLVQVAEYRYILANLFCASKVYEKKDMLKIFRENIKRMNFKQNKYLKGQRKIRTLIFVTNPFLYDIFIKIQSKYRKG